MNSEMIILKSGLGSPNEPLGVSLQWHPVNEYLFHRSFQISTSFHMHLYIELDWVSYLKSWEIFLAKSIFFCIKFFVAVYMIEI